MTGNHILTNNTINISGGVLNLSGTGLLQPATVNLTSGTLSGTADLTVQNTMVWSGGTLSGSGRTIIAPGALMNINNSPFTVTLSRNLENAGTVTLTGGAINSSVVITNRAGALFDVQNAQSLSGGGSRMAKVRRYHVAPETGDDGSQHN